MTIDFNFLANLGTFIAAIIAVLGVVYMKVDTIKKEGYKQACDEQSKKDLDNLADKVRILEIKQNEHNDFLIGFKKDIEYIKEKIDSYLESKK